MQVVADLAKPQTLEAPIPNPERRHLWSGDRLLLDAAVCLFAYLYGSLPLVYLLGRVRRVDLRERGSGNVGATNLWAVAGNWPAIAGWIGDASKGLVPAAVARWLGSSRETAEMAGVCGVAGQCWPIFLGMSGGRGISAFVGAAAWINPRAWVVSLQPMIVGGLLRTVPMLGPRMTRVTRRLKTTRGKSVPLGCLLGALVFPLACQCLPIRGHKASLAPWLLPTVIVLRRLTARLPDDETLGPTVRPQALVYRLLFDRNTRD